MAFQQFRVIADPLQERGDAAPAKCLPVKLASRQLAKADQITGGLNTALAPEVMQDENLVAELRRLITVCVNQLIPGEPQYEILTEGAEAETFRGWDRQPKPLTTGCQIDGL
jgi:hypothetical protein